VSSDESSEPLDTVNVNDEIVEFWTNQKWPIDGHKELFLGRAVVELGEARFGKDWIAILDPRSRIAKNQRSAIFKELAAQFQSGDVGTTIRLPLGKHRILPSYVWNRDHFRRRFSYCLFDDADLPGASGDEEGDAPIYVNHSDFNVLLNSKPKKPFRIDDIDELPKFVSVLVRLAHHLQITADSTPLRTKIIHDAWMQMAQEAGIPFKDYKGLKRPVGTLLRPPGAKGYADKKIVRGPVDD
jgi:hypothetical protein